ncbi:CHAT domain-containing protein [Lactarius hengduanensis]|nr:CHAT domain-containing protein [Lactarius hengduanensis]
MADLPRYIDEIDSFVARSEEFLLRSPRSHPTRLACIHNLATALLDRYALSDAADDLDKSIVHLIESILLPPRLWLEHGPMILHTLWLLASALFRRSKVSGRPEDAIFAANYLRYLLDQPRDISGVPRRLVTTMLVDALAFQVNSKAGNAMQNIREMAVLCRGLLTSDVSDGDTTRSILQFAKAVLSAIRPWVPDPPLDQVIECLRLVKMHKPELRDVQFALAFCLGTRYCMTFVNVDYEEAASMMDEIIASSSPGDSRDEFVARVQRFVTGLAFIRSKTHQTPEYSEETIYRARAFLSSPPEEHSFNPLVNYSLEDTEKQRFHYFGSVEGLRARSSDSLVSRLVDAFGRKDEGDDSEFGRVYKKAMHLEDILSWIQNNDVMEIEEVIEDGRSTLASFDRGSSFTFYILGLFGLILSEAFKRTNEIRYLDESMSAFSQVLEYPFAGHIRPGILRLLSWSLLTRSVRFRGRRMQDVDEGVELLSQCVNDGHASLPDRFQLACVWASFARGFRHPSTLTAYENAISSMQKALLFAPTLQQQHATLATMPDYSNRMPLDYASYQVNQRQLEEAIETLERGRALLWSEMRHLRTSIDQLLEADPDLGHKFTAVNRDLEVLTTSIPPSHKLSMDDSAADDLRAVDPFGRLLLKQRKLLEERDKLISQIQILPGFDSFLTSPSFDQLRSVASCGPVIIVNHSKWRSDILILLHHMPPSLIPTPANFYRRARALKNKLFASRNRYGLDSSHYDQTLALVLAKLYKLVGKPVIDRLCQLKVPEQSRIWWCPTSVFCSLPLHAMGPIPSDDGEKRYFLDLYICSYTPTLSALIQSRNRNLGSRSSERPSLLLVAQPNPSLPTVKGEIQVVQALNTKVTSLISDAATPAAVIDGFRCHQFVHFACHGTLEAGEPFEAGFELYGDERLTLLEIVRSHLPTAEFAFLSACHTAEVTEGSIVDEVLHLAAAVQYCGFKSVVGTMWAMVDEDGRDLAEHFYKALFSTTSRRDQGVPYHERSAKALRFAVKKLRKKKRITLERWVNFVHYGA